MNTFFTYLRRINSLLFLAGLLALALLFFRAASSDSAQNKQEIVTTSATPGSKETLRFYLDELQDIPGSDTQMLKLTASKTKPGPVYSGYGRDTRNILFLSGAEKSARWLFPDQNHVIHTSTQLQLQVKDKKTPGADNVTVAFYYLYSDKDTTGDGKITNDDNTSMGLSKANGEGFTAVLAGIDRVYSVSLTENDGISVLYRIGKRLRHARYSAVTLGKVFDREVTAIPGVEYRD